MRVVCQRVSRAEVRVGDVATGRIGAGLAVLLGIARADTAADADRLAGKVARLRIFEGDDRKFDRSLLETGGAALVVSQFTLIADSTRPAGTAGEGWKRPSGNRPSFAEAARPEQAEPLYDRFCAELAALGVAVERGVFGALMDVELVNTGPVTLVLDS